MSEVIPPGFVIEQQPQETAQQAQETGQSATLPPGFVQETEQQRSMTLEEEAQEVFGFDPNIVQRGTILPIGVNAQGEPELAIPEIGKELLTSFLLPGRVARGGDFTAEDALRFSLDFTVPAAARRFATGPAARRMSRGETIQRAPQTEEVAREASRGFTQARQSGARMSSDEFLDFASRIESRAIEEGVDPLARELTPRVISVLESIGRRIGREVDVADMSRIRRQIGIAASSNIADERRIAMEMMDILDDTVDDVLRQPGLRNARRLWSQAKKAQEIEEIIDRATRQASGFENGLRIGFRQLLNNPRRLRGFTKAEQQVMRDIEKGTPTRRALRFISKLGPSRSGSSNIVGTAIGGGGGFAAGGPVAAAAIPVAGNIAGTAADRSAGRAADLLRAMVATGPQASPQIPSRLPGIAMGSAFPLAGTSLPVVEQSEEDQRILQQMFGNR